MLASRKSPLKKKLLLTVHRLEVGALIQESALNQRAFHWAIADSQTMSGTRVSMLEYRTARAQGFFQFDHYRRQHYALYAWARGDEREEHFTGSWPNQARHVRRWIASLDTGAPSRTRAP